MSPTLSVQYSSEANPWAQAMREQVPRHLHSSMFKLGGFFRKRLKEPFRTGIAGTRPWHPGSGLIRRKGGKNAGKLVRTKRKTIGGRLPSALGFFYNKSSGRLALGWRSKSARTIGDKFERGQVKTVTPAMRRQFFKAGLGIKKGKKIIVQPPRPLFKPILDAHRKNISKLIENGVRMAMDKSSTKAKANPKKSGKLF